ncbi:MAG TPA: hypothetical protein V6D17_03775, partial [Candidatus Obscuribacterales bacterium]
MKQTIEPSFVAPSEESVHPELARAGNKSGRRKRIERPTRTGTPADNAFVTAAAAPAPIIQNEIPESVAAPAPVIKATDAPCGCGGKAKTKKSKKTLVVGKGETIALAGSAQFASVENHGRIELPHGAVLTAADFTNEGEVLSQEGDLEIHVERLIAHSGSCLSPAKITLKSDNDLVVRGGAFHAPDVAFDCEKTLDVSANSIDGTVSVKAGAVSLGVKSGELHVAEHICHGDPVYWNEGTGDMTVAEVTTAGEDVVIWSNGANIYIRNIDTTGGSGSGRVTIVTNAGATRPGDDYPF